MDNVSYKYLYKVFVYIINYYMCIENIDKKISQESNIFEKILCIYFQTNFTWKNTQIISFHLNWCSLWEIERVHTFALAINSLIFSK